MGIVFGKTGVAEPAFDILLSRSTAVPYQLRKYGPRYACETEYSATDNSMGFRALAGYIGVGTAPQNDGGTGISMTAPVVTEQSKGKAISMTAPVVTDTVGDDIKKMAFILPAEYDSMDKIPKPTNPKVKIKEIPPANGAVHTFSGSCNDDKAKVKAKELIGQLRNDGVELDEKSMMEKFELWQFHPPFTIPMMRKNEIWIGLSEDQVNDLIKNYKN
jgi:hypothetical protein